jgi:transposase
MLSITGATRVFVAVVPIDLRGSFNALSGQVKQVLAQDPLSGHWFVFTNRRRNRLKILIWDGSGYWICAKRLERGRFTWITGEHPSALLRPEELTALVCGLEVKAKADWFRR